METGLRRALRDTERLADGGRRQPEVVVQDQDRALLRAKSMEAALDHVTIADVHGVRHEVTPTFYERFEDAFLREDAEFVQAVLDDRDPPLTLRDATESTRIALAMMQSLREKRVVTL